MPYIVHIYIHTYYRHRTKPKPLRGEIVVFIYYLKIKFKSV